MAIPATQINYLTISKDTSIEDPQSDAGRQWEAALDLLEAYQGFRRLYWGRSPENWSKVQLHVGKPFFQNWLRVPLICPATS